MKLSKRLVVLSEVGALWLASAAMAAPTAPWIHIHQFLGLTSLRGPGGGGGVGNGGGTVVCRRADHSIASVEVLDLYEARVIRGIETDIGQFPGSWREKAQAVIDRLGRVSELRLRVYSEWLRTFESESMSLTGVTFNNVPDAMTIVVPNGCAFEQGAVQIIPRFEGDHRYYLNGELWAAMDETQRAALVLHEIVYREALSYGHADSINTRYFVSIAGSARMAAMDIGDFFYLVGAVHFEQTDLPLQTSQVRSRFSPVRWWRSDRDAPMHQDPQPLDFQGRVVVNVGACREEGCRTWMGLTQNFLNLQICDEVQLEIGLDKLYSSSGVAAFRPGEACRSVAVLSQSTNAEDKYLSVALYRLRQADGYAYYLDDPLYSLSVTRDPEGLVGMVAEIAYVQSGDAAAFFRRSHANVSFLESDWTLSEGTLSTETRHCGLWVEYPTHTRNGFVHFYAGGYAAGCRPSFTKIDGDRVSVFSLRSITDALQFDELGNYATGGGIVAFGRMGGVRRVFEDTLKCLDDLPCMLPGSAQAFPEFVSVVGPLRATLPGPTDYVSCRVRDSLLSLHSTLYPQALTLDEACSTIGLDGAPTTYPAGTVLRLDGQGKITDAIVH